MARPCCERNKARVSEDGGQRERELNSIPGGGGDSAELCRGELVCVLEEEGVEKQLKRSVPPLEQLPSVCACVCVLHMCSCMHIGVCVCVRTYREGS